MSDIFNQMLSFAADPPEGGGGTKSTPSGGGLQADAATEDPPAPTDPPENGGGTGSGTTDPSSTG